MLLAGSGCMSMSADKKPYVEEEEGKYTWRATFVSKEDTASEQLAAARKAHDKGRLKKARHKLMYLYRRWPNSEEAPLAVREYADILFEDKEWKDAYKAYQYLVDNYAGRMEDYDDVLQRQFEISVKIMKRKRLRWILGGYRAPEYAVEYFEGVVKNGPQWSRAPETQFMVGKCNQDAKEYELAITAYAVLGYRYPDSGFAEKGAWEQIVCLKKLRKEYPASPDVLDRLLTATTVFLSTYPQSEHKSDIIQTRNDLYEIKASRVFDDAAFYAKVPKESEAAILYYEKMIEEYPKSQLVPYAEEQIAEIKRLMALPQNTTPSAPHSRPLPFLKDSSDVDG